MFLRLQKKCENKKYINHFSPLFKIGTARAKPVFCRTSDFCHFSFLNN